MPQKPLFAIIAKSENPNSLSFKDLQGFMEADTESIYELKARILSFQAQQKQGTRKPQTKPEFDVILLNPKARIIIPND